MLAKQLGHKVTGSDSQVYPPMSTLLESQGVAIIEGYDPAQLTPKPDLVVIGNAMSRGNPCVEAVLNQGLPYTSGPQWLHDFLLQDCWVLAVSGTHGKTTTASMLAWILEDCGYQPGFLIGGVASNFNASARLGDSPFFVVEADEYDSAFFDKRSKFIHYQPKTLVINNLEFDHADIFDDLAAIQKQFHHVIRTVPGIGQIIAPSDDPNVAETLAMGCWSECVYAGPDGQWQSVKKDAAGSQFDVYFAGDLVGSVSWDLVGDHNVRNALMALSAARHVGVTPGLACQSLERFINTKRRLEWRGERAGVTVYDDFAHHPTAIRLTLEGLRAKVGAGRILAVLEPRSNTMKQGVHKDTLAASLASADSVFLYQPQGLDWSLDAVADRCAQPTQIHTDIGTLVVALSEQALPGDTVLVMSNGGVGGIHDKLLSALSHKGEKHDG